MKSFWKWPAVFALLTGACLVFPTPVSAGPVGFPGAAQEGRVSMESADGKVTSLIATVAGPWKQDQFFRFSATAVLKNTRPMGTPARTAQSDINFSADLVCIVIHQLDANGKELCADASLGVAKDGTYKLTVEAAPVEGIASVQLECRMIGIAGNAEFGDLSFEREAGVLYLPEKSEISLGKDLSPALQIGGTLRPGLIFHGQNLDSSPDASGTLRDTKLPYSYGLRLLSFNVWFPGVTRQDPSRNLETLSQTYPEASFFLRWWIGPRGTFFSDFPGERMSFDDGTHFAATAAPESSLWRKYVSASIRRAVLNLRKLPSARQIAGVVPMYYVTGEWQVGDPGSPYREKTGAFRTSGFDEIQRAAFARWALEKYGTLEEVNRRWRTSFSRSEDVAVPSSQERFTGGRGAFRDPLLQQREIDFSRFQSEAVAEAIQWSCSEFREVFHKRVLTGPFYGYALEHAWNSSGLQEQGHLALKAVLRAPVVDFYGSPYSYNSDNRGFGKPVDTNAVLDSAALHGKVAFLEEDTYTHVAKPPGGFIAPGEHLKTKTLTETLAVLKRNFGTCLARGYVLYWMGLLEDGRFDLPEIWDAYRPWIDWLKKNPVRPAYRPQVALVIDEEAVSLLNESSRAVAGRWLYELRSILKRVDVTLGIYLQSDLDRIPDSVRCLVLAMPYQLGEKDLAVLRERWMKDGRTLVFCDLPGAFASPACDSGLLTGISSKIIDSPIQPTSLVEPKGLLADFSGQTIGEPTDRASVFWRPGAKLPPVCPYLVIDDPHAEILARYENDGQHRPSLALKRMPGWTGILTGVHSLAPAMWRTIFSDAGVHLYLDTLSTDFDFPDVVEATEDFVMIQSGVDGKRTVRLPARCREVTTLAEQPGVIARDAETFTFEFKKGIPEFFLLKP